MLQELESSEIWTVTYRHLAFDEATYPVIEGSWSTLHFS